MSTSASISADEFQALEQKVLRAIEIVKREREARAQAEAEVARLQQQIEQQKQQHATELEEHTSAASTAQAQLSSFQQERADVRQRVERMLQQMDDLL